MTKFWNYNAGQKLLLCVDRELVVFLLLTTCQAFGADVVIHQTCLIVDLKWLQVFWPTHFGLQHALIQGGFPEKGIFCKKYSNLPLLSL